jgi:hypothetical protein
MTDKIFALAILRLLSALESWAFSSKTPIPDYLLESISNVSERLEKEVLK